LNIQFDYRQQQSEYLLRITRAMTSRLDLGEVLTLVLQSAVELLGGRAGLIALRGADDTFSVMASYGLQRRWLPLFAPLLTGIPTSADDLPKDRWSIPRLRAKLAQVAAALTLDLHQGVALPLIVDNSVTGVIYVFRTQAQALFSTVDRQILAGFADQAAIAVRNARLYQALVAEKQQLETILEHSADGVLIVGRDDRIQVMNRAMEQMTDWSPTDAQGQFASRVIALVNKQGIPLDWPQLPVRSEAQNPSHFRLEGYLLRQDGSRGPFVSVVYTPLYDEENALHSVVVNVTDISHFKEAEEIKSAFVSAISHELKTPLALILGYADTLARQDVKWDDETFQEGLATIKEEAGRLTRLVDNLLDTARVQAGGLSLRLAPTQLDALAAQVVEEFRVLQTGHLFTLDFPSDYPPARCDPERIRQVLINLLSNATKYSPPGTLVRVAGWEEQKVVGIAVSDEGPGIPPDQQERVFERFVRGREQQLRATKGAGLGLFISRGIVEAHGGRIWVDGTVQHGTRVCFTLPRANPRQLTDTHHMQHKQRSGSDAGR